MNEVRRVAFLITILLIATSAATAQDVSGRWRGSWTDSNSGHTGPLQARFRETDDAHYRVVFTGRFWKVIPFRFATTLDVVGRDGNNVFLAGESRLGPFGSFNYSAVSDGCQFTSDFSSRRWQGRFEMSR
jgi:hypothetical protein